MAGDLKNLREHKQELARQANLILAEKGSTVWSTEDKAKYDGIMDTMERVSNQISAHQRLLDAEADQHFSNVAPNGKPADGSIGVMDAVALYLRHGTNVNAEQLAAIRNAMSTTTAAEGGYTVPTEIASMVIDKLKAFGGMREAATILPTTTGVSMSWPTSDGTADVGAIVGQNVAVSAADITFGTIGLNTFYYTSNKIALPLELITDSAIDVVGYVVDRLATRIARIQNTHFTTGAGTTLPDGVVPKAAVGKTGTTGQTLTVIYDDLVDLKHSVNRAYRKNAKFMLNDLSVATLSKIKDTTGRPIWVPSVTLGVPDTCLGYEVVINDDVAVMAANAKSILFGDFKAYTIRDVIGTTRMQRFDDSAFALSNQVGFCAWQRSGGNLLDVAAVRHYANSAT